ncbi:hypothetical protein BKA56DRAFT_144505 [Ilyonectria sp. MPI-CAGE-AT-0026]|nr:hypothetical protein BKA56DRAFT_144505 [Ilyonectria sp. MPI-CAGE-AT-0026]
MKDPNKKALKALEVNAEVLQNINDQFVSTAYKSKFKIHSFQEARGLSGMKGFDSKIVGDFSSKLDFPPDLETVETIDSDHRQMVKCVDKNDARYRAVLGVLRHFMRQSSEHPVPTETSPGDTAQRKLVAAKPDHGSNVQTCFYVPFPRNKRFVGRAETLKQLQEKLFTESEFPTVALLGLGGIGKTQVALNLAFWAKENYYSVFWIPALSNASFEQACTGIAKALGIPCADGEDPKEAVQMHLNSENAGRWFLIIDNADDDDVMFECPDQSRCLYDYLPNSQSGRILFTTRSRKLAVAVAGDDLVELSEITQEEGKSFLKKALFNKSLLDEEHAVIEFLDELTYLPLAITQAVAYLNETEITITEYLRLFRNTDQDLVELMNTEFLDNTRYRESQNAVATTWLISFHQIRKTDEPALELLSFVACIEPKAIPRSMLPPLGTDQQFTRAIGTLCGYKFLSKREDGEMFDMHSLVHLAMRLMVTEQGSLNAIKQDAIEHLDRVFPNDDWENREIWQRYLPHALRLLQTSDVIETTERCNLGYWVGRCLDEDGRTKQAVEQLQNVTNIQAQTLAEDDNQRLSSQHILGMVYRGHGQVKESIKLLEYVVAIKARKLTEEDPNLLASQHELARAYTANGQVKEAIQLLEHIVAIEARILAEEHPDRLASQHNLAGAYKSNGQVKEAIQLLEHIVAIEARILAEEHPDRLASQHNLAGAYKSNGQVKEAIQLLEHIVAIEARILAEEHPDRLTSQHELAGAYTANGQVREAIQLLEHVVAIRARILAEEHPHRLASQHNLAGAYESNGQVREAIQLLEHVVAIRARILAEEHPHRLASQHNLAGAYESNGQVREAIQLLEHVVATEAQTLAEDHPSRLSSQDFLQWMYETYERPS